MAQDDEVAELTLALAAASTDDDRQQQESGRSIQEWTPELDMHVMVYDRLTEILTAVYAASEKKFKPLKLKPYRRPETALDRAKRRQKHAEHRSLSERVRVKKPN